MRVRTGVVTTFAVRKPIVKRTNFRIALMPMSGAGDIISAIVVVSMKAQSGTK
jgi:hypothetical protein